MIGNKQQIIDGMLKALKDLAPESARPQISDFVGWASALTDALRDMLGVNLLIQIRNDTKDDACYMDLEFNRETKTGTLWVPWTFVMESDREDKTRNGNHTIEMIMKDLGIWRD